MYHCATKFFSRQSFSLSLPQPQLSLEAVRATGEGGKMANNSNDPADSRPFSKILIDFPNESSKTDIGGGRPRRQTATAVNFPSPPAFGLHAMTEDSDSSELPSPTPLAFCGFRHRGACAQVPLLVFKTAVEQRLPLPTPFPLYSSHSQQKSTKSHSSTSPLSCSRG